MNTAIEWVGAQPQIPVYLDDDGMSFDGLAVLDVGCGTGKDLMHPKYVRARERCGIDPWAERIEYGRKRYPEVTLTQGSAEEMPYPSEHFDYVVSRVTLPYVNVPEALYEIERVLKPGGKLLLTLHDWRQQVSHWLSHVKRREWKALLDIPYVIAASVVCCAGFDVPARPFRTTRTTVQTVRCARWLLKRAGFAQIECAKVTRDGKRFFIVKAVKPQRST